MSLPRNTIQWIMSMHQQFFAMLETGRMVTFPCSAGEKGPKKCWSDKKYTWHCKDCKTVAFNTTDLSCTCMVMYMYRLHNLDLRFLQHVNHVKL